MASVCPQPGCPNLTPCPTHKRRGKYHGREGSTRQWRKTRARILRRDQHTCRRCGRRATHVDHVEPLAQGGTDDDSNLQALCADCNLRKGTR